MYNNFVNYLRLKHISRKEIRLELIMSLYTSHQNSPGSQSVGHSFIMHDLRKPYIVITAKITLRFLTCDFLNFSLLNPSDGLIRAMNLRFFAKGRRRVVAKVNYM